MCSEFAGTGNCHSGVVLVRVVGYLTNMRKGGKVAVCLLASLALAPLLKAQARNTGADAGPYGAIVDRNIFDLQPIPPPPKITPPPPTPPNVKLIGLLATTDHPQAVIWSQEASMPPKPAVTWIMREGQRQANVEVLEIDIAARTAKVQIDDNVTVLKLEEKGAPAGPTGPVNIAAAAARRGQPAAPALPAPPLPGRGSGKPATPPTVPRLPTPTTPPALPVPNRPPSIPK